MITLPEIKLSPESLAILLKSNLSCHANKPLNAELIDELTKQIIDSIAYSVNRHED